MITQEMIGDGLYGTTGVGKGIKHQMDRPSEGMSPNIHITQPHIKLIPEHKLVKNVSIWSSPNHTSTHVITPPPADKSSTLLLIDSTRRQNNLLPIVF